MLAGKYPLRRLFHIDRVFSTYYRSKPLVYLLPVISQRSGHLEMPTTSRKHFRTFELFSIIFFLSSRKLILSLFIIDYIRYVPTKFMNLSWTFHVFIFSLLLSTLSHHLNYEITKISKILSQNVYRLFKIHFVRYILIKVASHIIICLFLLPRFLPSCFSNYIFSLIFKELTLEQ